MGIKDLFNSSDKSIIYSDYKTQKEAFEPVESMKNAEEAQRKDDTFIPPLDYSDPIVFAHYGSAELYYKGALDKIINFYPYDGSKAEQNAFFNGLLEVEKYVFDQLYPTSLGFGIMSANGWGTQTALTAGGWGLSDNPEYITFYGGPNADSSLTSLAKQSPNAYSNAFNYSNIYDEDIYKTAGLPSDYGKGTRLSNLRCNLDDGITIECWLHTGSTDQTSGDDTTKKKCIVDLWNNETPGDDAYGRVLWFLNSTDTDPFKIVYESGSATYTKTLSADLPASTLGSWNHYAVTLQNSGSDLHITFYVNGELNNKTVTSDTIGSELNSNKMMGRLGALLGPSTAFASADAGYGKLSGSMDEFRFWKTARNQKQIAENYFSHVGGGTNTDIANTTLGVYYKFNEGITGDATTDSVVLDYGGRICNGAWTGYTSNSRDTGSAILLANAASKERPSPIVRSNNPSYVSTRSTLLEKGRDHDLNNNSMFINYSPSWVIEDHDDYENNNLQIISHIMGAYFDKLYNLISAIPNLRGYKYDKSSEKPLPFAMHLPQSMGMYVPGMFVDATILEQFENRTESEFFEGNLSQAKNLIYQNIFNNITNIYKSKGTENAVRNVLRCFNIDDSLIRLKTYSRNNLYELKSNLRQITQPNKRLNLNTVDNYGAVVYQRAEGGATTTNGTIAGLYPTAGDNGIVVTNPVNNHTIRVRCMDSAFMGSDNPSGFGYDMWAKTSLSAPPAPASGWSDIYFKIGATNEETAENIVKAFNGSSDTTVVKYYSNNTSYRAQYLTASHVGGGKVLVQSTCPKYFQANGTPWDSTPLEGVKIRQQNGGGTGTHTPPVGTNTLANGDYNDGYLSGGVDPTAFLEPNKPGYITGSLGSSFAGAEDPYGCTVEAEIVFPKFFKERDQFDRNFLSSSLFGMHTVSASLLTDCSFETLDGTDTTIPTNDYANFQVYAVRDELYSSNVRFVLSSSSPYPLAESQSSTFFEVYDDNRWNFSVRIKPENPGISDVVADAVGNKDYTVIFRGVNTTAGVINEKFELESTITSATAQNFLQANKRLYCGARRTNITGTLLQKSDVYISNAKYWAKALTNSALDQHVQDANNSGIDHTYENLSGLDPNNRTLDLLNIDTLGLEWNFDVTSSAAGNDFYVQDFSSGSAGLRSKLGWLGEITKYEHPGYGQHFGATDIINSDIENSFKFVDPEETIASNMIQALSEDDTLFKIVETVPNYVFTIEKSMYQAISEEMMIFFAGALDFHNLIGDPVNRYRDRYKNMEVLREIFFQRVTKVSDVKKYIDYYKWFDDALSTILSQLMPASADFVSDVLNVVESHALERNKYATKFPTLETEKPELEASLEGFEASNYPGFLGLSPIPESPRNTKKHVPYWKKRAQRTDLEIATGNPTVDAQREKVRIVATSQPRLITKPTMVSTTHGVWYEYRAFAKRSFSKFKNIQALTPITVSPRDPVSIKGGVNFPPSKKIDFAYGALRPAGPVNTAGGVFVPQNVLLSLEEDFVDFFESEDPSNTPAEKKKKYSKVRFGPDYVEGSYMNVKSTIAFPFNMMSSTLATGYQKFVQEEVRLDTNIVNLHNDVYGPDMEKPMQGPFTDAVVGGHQSRHVPLNKGTDTWATRPEAWMLLLGQFNIDSGAVGMAGPDYPYPEANTYGTPPYPATLSQKAWLYRDMTVKSPVNIKNIRRDIPGWRPGPPLGNYQHSYEIVSTFGKFTNPGHLVQNMDEPVAPGPGLRLPPEAFPGLATSSMVVNTLLDIRSREGGKMFVPAGGIGGHARFMPEYDASYLQGEANQSVISNRFGAPGGMDTTQVGMKDFRGSEYSAYNVYDYRNLMVIRPSQGPSGTIGATEGMRIYDIHGKDYGLRSQLSRHTARFGRDSLWVPNDICGASYDQLPGFHKVHRNTLGALTGKCIAMPARNILFSQYIVPSGGIDCNPPSPGSPGYVPVNGLRSNNPLEGDFFEITVPRYWQVCEGPEPLITTNLAGPLTLKYIITGTLSISPVPQSIEILSESAPADTRTNVVNALNGVADPGKIKYIGDDPTSRAQYLSASESVDFSTYIDLITTISSSAGNHITISGSYPEMVYPIPPATTVPLGGGRDESTYDIRPAQYDNFFVKHQIPRSTRQYAWIAGALANANEAWTPPITPRNFLVTSGTTLINAYDFVDKSPIGTDIAAGSGRSFGWALDCAQNFFIPGDSVGMNTNLVDVIQSDINTIGSTDYTALQNKSMVPDGYRTPTSDVVPGTAGVLNALIYNRGNSYGWTGWQAMHMNNHKILRKERNDNKLSLKNPDYTITRYDNPPVTMDGRPVLVNMDILEGKETTNLTVEMPYGENQYFNTNDLNNRFDFDQFAYITPFEQTMQLMRKDNYRLNWLVYRECIFPAERNEFLTYSRERTGYNNEFWRDDRTDRQTLGSTLPTVFDYTGACGSSWLLDEPVDFYTRTEPSKWTETFWNALSGASLLNVSGCAGELQNTYSSYFYYRSSVFNYPPINHLLPPPFGPMPDTVDGFMVWGGREWKFDWPAKAVLAGPLYARKSSLSSQLSTIAPHGISNPIVYASGSLINAWATGSAGGSVVPQQRILDPLKCNITGSWLHLKNERLSGEAKWEAPTLAGIVEKNQSGGGAFVSYPSEPWFDEYGDFKYELQKMAKDYAIVPEFRISEHIKSYIKNGILTPSTTDTFEIPGTTIDSSQDSFYRDYSNTDFLKGYLNVKANSLLNATEIRLVCDAAIRFNPYKGFYPAQRSLQMVNQFKDSYKNCYQVATFQMDPLSLSTIGAIDARTGNVYGVPTRLTSSGDELFAQYPGATRPLNQVMFSPGILYNTIKSGIAVDYPIVSDLRKPLNGCPALSNYSKAFQYGDWTTDGNVFNMKISDTIINRMTYCNVSGGVGTDNPKENPWYAEGDESIYKDFFDKRIPFEAIIKPEKYLENSTVYDCEQDYWWNGGDNALGQTPQKIVNTFKNNPSDHIYTLMSRNFFGAVPEFFLKDDDFTKVHSSTFVGTRTFPSGAVFMARVKLLSSYHGVRDYTNEYIGSVGAQGSGSTNVWLNSGPRAITASHDAAGNITSIQTLSGNAWFPIPQHPRVKVHNPPSSSTVDSYGYNNGFQENFTLYSRTDAFGPPMAGTYAPPNQNLFSSFGTSQWIQQLLTSSFGYASWGYFHMGEGLDTPPPAPGGVCNVGNCKGYPQGFQVGPWDRSSSSGIGLDKNYPDMRPLPIFDSLTGYNWAYTPPYYDGEAWADLVFYPEANKEYDLKRILSEVKTEYWRVDPGYENPDIGSNPLQTTEFVYNVTGAVYDAEGGSSGYDRGNVVYTYPAGPYTGRMVNQSAMQANASINLFGVEEVQFTQEAKSGDSSTRNEIIGQRWVIQPKFETPHMNFSDIGTRPLIQYSNASAGKTANITMPTYGSASVPQGMWHQFGIVDPDPDKGIFLQIGDIEQNWLKYHYKATLESSVYNNYDLQEGPGLHKNVRSLTDLCGFQNTTQRKRLGELKESLTVYEAVIAVPYVVTRERTKDDKEGEKYYESKRFIDIPRARFDGVLDTLQNSDVGSSLDAAGFSIREQLQKMQKYVMPPQFDFIDNRKIDPVAMYIFEFSYIFDKDDLSYIWQNLAPRNYKQVFMQSDSVAHKLIPTELLSERNLADNENLRWMVFKVKQDSQADYYTHTYPQSNEATDVDFLRPPKTYEERYLQYNWPYDYLSFVELIRMEAQLKFGNHAEDLMKELPDPSTIGASGASISGVGSIPQGDLPVTQQTATQLDTSETIRAPKASLNTAVPTMLQESKSGSPVVGGGQSGVNMYTTSNQSTTSTGTGRKRRRKKTTIKTQGTMGSNTSTQSNRRKRKTNKKGGKKY